MLHMQIKSYADMKQIYQYMSPKLAGTNNVTGITGLHTLYINVHMPWTNMPITLHIMLLYTATVVLCNAVEVLLINQMFNIT